MAKGTTKSGFVNVNNQEVVGASTSTPNHPYAKSYRLKCRDCGHEYNSNGCDIHNRRCPKHDRREKVA